MYSSVSRLRNSGWRLLELFWKQSQTSNSRGSCRKDLLTDRTKLWWSLSQGTWRQRPGIKRCPLLQHHGCSSVLPDLSPSLFASAKGRSAGWWWQEEGVSLRKIFLRVRLGKCRKQNIWRWPGKKLPEHSLCSPGCLTCVHLYGRLGLGQVLRATWSDLALFSVRTPSVGSWTGSAYMDFRHWILGF